MLRSVALVVAITGLVLASACGGGGNGSDKQANSDATATAAMAAGCSEKTDFVVITDDPDLRLDCRKVAIGERVRVRVENWPDTGPLEFYPLTEEQSDVSFSHWSRMDLVRIGELTTTAGEGSFDLALRSEFRTRNGQTLHVAPGDKLVLWALQKTEHGSHGSGTQVVVR